MPDKSWIAVGLDGTLAYESDTKNGEIGHPNPNCMDLVKNALEDGMRVKILTPRVAFPVCDCGSMSDRVREAHDQKLKVQEWLKKHGLPGLEVTSQIDLDMDELWWWA